jgi:hypothetical protein
LTKEGLIHKIMRALEEEWPVAQPEKTINLVLVGDETFALTNLFQGVSEVPSFIDPWLKDQGLKVKRWLLHKVNLPGKASEYDFWKLIEELQRKNLCVMDGENAWYILMAQKLPWPIGGTIGGDWFKQEKGQVPGKDGYMRVPGISFADFGCVYGLRYNQPPQGSVYPKDRNNVLGWMAHEICHNVGLLPCRCGHATACIMANGCYTFPDAVLGCDTPWIVGPTFGDEKAELVRYDFLAKVDV